MTLSIKFILILLCAAYCAVAFTAITGWRRIKIFNKPLSNTFKTRVSVIIPARNEANAIKNLLDDISSQDYPEDLLEIIVVDDHSEDNTGEIVRNYPHPNLNLIQLKAHKALNSYKKKAIADAIDSSSGSLIVTTDADCRVGPEWISSIAAKYEQDGSKIISGPVCFFEEKNIFEEVQGLEFMLLVSLGAASIANKHSGSCNGANLAYEKEAFYQAGGFNGIDNLASGDDELLLHKIMRKFPGEAYFLKSRKAIVRTHAKPDLKAFIQQRKRWASKSVHYNERSMKIVGFIVYFFNLVLLTSFISGFFSKELLLITVIVFFIKFIMEFLWVLPVSLFFGKSKLLPLLIPVCFIHMFYIVYIGIAGQGKTYEWKNRKVS